jgi:hypothetical protein
MAGDWIKMRVDLDDDPAVIGISAGTGLDTPGVVGRLHKLWSWADRQSRDGHAPSVTEMWLDRYVGCEGFASAMQQQGWLTVDTSGISFPNFDRHNGKSAKTRALATSRQRNAREAETSRTKRDKTATREEKRRSNSPVVPLFAKPDWLPANEWAAFEDMRKQIRKPMTDHARMLVIKQLEKLRAAGHDPATILNNSTRNSWQDVYAPKGQAAQQPGRLAI